jgi:hypothetical protein
MSLSNNINDKIGILIGKLDTWKKAEAMKKAYINVATEMIQKQIQHETQESAIRYAIRDAMEEFQKNEQLKLSQLSVGVDLLTNEPTDTLENTILKTAVDIIAERERAEKETIHAILDSAVDIIADDQLPNKLMEIAIDMTQTRPTKASEELDELSAISDKLEQLVRLENDNITKEKMFSFRDFLKYIIQAIKRFLRNLLLMVFPAFKKETYEILLGKLLDILRTFAEKNGIILEKDKDEKELMLEVALQLLEPTRMEANQMMDIAIQLLNQNNTADPTLHDRIYALYNYIKDAIKDANKDANKDAKMDGFSLESSTEKLKSGLGQLLEIAIQTMPKMTLLEIRDFFNQLKLFNKILSKVDDEACIDKTSEICEKVIRQYPEINSDTIKMIGKIDDKCVFYDTSANKTYGLDIIDAVECPDSA